jgi:hypothetical protein
MCRISDHPTLTIQPFFVSNEHLASMPHVNTIGQIAPALTLKLK